MKKRYLFWTLSIIENNFENEIMYISWWYQKQFNRSLIQYEWHLSVQNRQSVDVKKEIEYRLETIKNAVIEWKKKMSWNKNQNQMKKKRKKSKFFFWKLQFLKIALLFYSTINKSNSVLRFFWFRIAVLILDFWFMWSSDWKALIYQNRKKNFIYFTFLIA